jgi:hypothetical protein
MIGGQDRTCNGGQGNEMKERTKANEGKKKNKKMYVIVGQNSEM